MNTDLILRARAVANEAEQRGFPNTAEAMRAILKEMLSDDSPKGVTESTPDRIKLDIYS